MSEFTLRVGKQSPSKTLVDPGSLAKIKFNYRLPNNQERVLYSRRSMQKKGKKVVMNVRSAAIEGAKDLILSFEFPDPDPDTQILLKTDAGFMPLSCEEGAPGYRERWREVLAQAVPNMLESLGLALFSGVREVDDGLSFEFDDAELEEGKARPN